MRMHGISTIVARYLRALRGTYEKHLLLPTIEPLLGSQVRQPRP